MTKQGAHEWLKERVLPYIGPALAIVGSLGWIRSELGSLDRGDADMKQRLTDSQADVRELRQFVMDHCTK